MNQTHMAPSAWAWRAREDRSPHWSPRRNLLGYEINIKFQLLPVQVFFTLPSTYPLKESELLQGILHQQEKLHRSSGHGRRQEVAAPSQMKYLFCYCVNAESSTWLLPPGEEEYLGSAPNACWRVWAVQTTAKTWDGGSAAQTFRGQGRGLEALSFSSSSSFAAWIFEVAANISGRFDEYWACDINEVSEEKLTGCEAGAEEL